MESEMDPETGETPRPGEPAEGGAPFVPVEAHPAEPVAASAPFVPIEPPQSVPGPQPYASQPGQPYPGQPGQPYPPQSWTAQNQPQPQPQPNPYGYPPYGYGVPQPPTGTSGAAIAALVLGICGFFFVTPIIGLVLGIVALSAIKRTGQRGKGLAISGIVLSGLWIAFFATAIAVHVANEQPAAQRDAGGSVVHQGAVSVFDLHPKDCFTLPKGLIGTTDSQARTFTVVPCSTPHDSEAIGSFTPTDSSFPGVDTLRTESTSQCLTVFSKYLVDTGSLPSGSQVQYLYPNEQAWSLGQRRVTCFLQFPSALMTESVYRDASSYNADQLRYLNAMHPLVDAISQLNSTPDSAPLSDLRQRASDVATATQTELAALTAGPWPSAAQPSVDALIAKHRDAAKFWNQAASADDTASFGDDIRQANGAFDMVDIQALRSALGLKTITPGSAS